MSRSTGDPAIDAVLGALDGLAERPPGEHPAVYAAVHERLAAVLDEPPPGTAGTGAAGPDGSVGRPAIGPAPAATAAAG